MYWLIGLLSVIGKNSASALHEGTTSIASRVSPQRLNSPVMWRVGFSVVMSISQQARRRSSLAGMKRMTLHLQRLADEHGIAPDADDRPSRPLAPVPSTPSARGLIEEPVSGRAINKISKSVCMYVSMYVTRWPSGTVSDLRSHRTLFTVINGSTINKKAVLPQGNRAMPQMFFSVEVRQQHSLQV